MGDELAHIEQHLRDRGLSTSRSGLRRLVVSRQRGPVWPDAGNSFWVCRLHSHWYVCTWAPRHYRVPETVSVLDIAEAFVDEGESAQSRVPAEMVSRFGLIETDDEEFDRLWNATQ
jgi:hypothetical protein